MDVVTYVMIGFAVLSVIDRILGGKLGLGAELEKGLMMIGALTVSMAGMLIMAPVIADLLKNISGVFPEFLDFSIVPASILANDMGGAHLAAQLAGDAAIGSFNGLVVASMMGCTVSFLLPYVLQVTDKKHHKDILFGLLCGIITVPVGCIVSGMVLGINIASLLLNLVPLVVFAMLVTVGILKFENVTIKLFAVLGWAIKAIISVGLVVGIVEFLTGNKWIANADSLGNAMDIIINIMCIMAGAFPLLYVLKKALGGVLKGFGKRIGVNETSAFGFLSTLGTSVTTFEAVDKMDRKGIVLNSAFAVSASFAFIDHLAFTLSFNAVYVPGVILGKVVSGMAAVVLAYVLYKRKYN